jgi:hypothetical protein
MIALMMGTETVPETLDFNELTRLPAREEFINFSRRESFTSYMRIFCSSGDGHADETGIDVGQPTSRQICDLTAITQFFV